MNANLRRLLPKILAVALVACIGGGCVFAMQAQTVVEPANPITSDLSRERVPITQGTTVTVDEDILDMDSDVTDAASEHMAENGVSFTHVHNSNNKRDGNTYSSDGPPAGFTWFTTSLENDEYASLKEQPLTSPDRYLNHPFTVTQNTIYDPIAMEVYVNDVLVRNFQGDYSGGMVLLTEDWNVWQWGPGRKLPNCASHTALPRWPTTTPTAATV